MTNDKEITQADRDAAADWCESQPFPSKQVEAPMIRLCEYDHHSLVQAFAAHRIASTTEAADLMDEMADALRELADAEKNYRWLHCTQGGGHIDTGRAWDKMRRAGALLAKLGGQHG
jgi:hypothetical protein